MYLKTTVTSGATSKPTWGLYGDNGKLVAWAGESFDSDYNAKRAAEAFKAGAATARYEVYLDKATEYRWRAWRSSDKVAASGERFYGQYEGECAADNVGDNARYATGP